MGPPLTTFMSLILHGFGSLRRLPGPELSCWIGKEIHCTDPTDSWLKISSILGWGPARPGNRWSYNVWVVFVEFSWLSLCYWVRIDEWRFVIFKPRSSHCVCLEWMELGKFSLSLSLSLSLSFSLSWSIQGEMFFCVDNNRKTWDDNPNILFFFRISRIHDKTDFKKTW